jgi:hypothetical protein
MFYNNKGYDINSLSNKSLLTPLNIRSLVSVTFLGKEIENIFLSRILLAIIVLNGLGSRLRLYGLINHGPLNASLRTLLKNSIL